MALTAAQQALLLFKKERGKSSTNDAFDYYEEGTNAFRAVYGQQIWAESDQIPNVAPNSSTGVVEYYVDEPTTAVLAAPKAFYSPNLVDCIPFNYGDGVSYNVTVKDSLGNQIFFGQGEWVIDPDTGIITFYGTVPANMPPTITFHKYVGAKGLTGGGVGASYEAVFVDSDHAMSTDEDSVSCRAGGLAYNVTLPDVTDADTAPRVTVRRDFQNLSQVLHLESFGLDESLFARDTAFHPMGGAGFNSSVNTIAVQSDGKILVGGDFTSYMGSGVAARLVRLNADGTLDTAFDTALGTGFGASITRVAVQSSGHIVVIGNFTTFNGNTRNRIVRLNSDGTESTWTSLSFNGNPEALLVLADGRTIVGGSFTTFNGNTRNSLVAINTNGSEDAGFYTNLGTGFTASQTVNDLAQQADGKIIVVGAFTAFNGNTRNRVLRLFDDGIEDTGFYSSSGANGLVQRVRIRPDGKIIFGGGFTTWEGSPYPYLVQISSGSTGTIDSDFMAGLAENPPTTTASTLEILPSGDIFVQGAFTLRNATKSTVAIRKDGRINEMANYNFGTGFSGGGAQAAAVAGSRLVIGGSFTSLDGESDTRITQVFTDTSNQILFNDRAYGRLPLHTMGEAWHLRKTDSGWHVTTHETETGWVNFPSLAAGTLITATTTNPTFGNITQHVAQWRRFRDSIVIYWFFRSSTAGTAGSGIYLFNLIAGMAIRYDRPVNTGTTLSTTSYSSNVGRFAWHTGTQTSVNGMLVPYSTTQLKAVMETQTGSGNAFQLWGSSNTNGSFNSTNIRSFTSDPIPMEEWFP